MAETRIRSAAASDVPAVRAIVRDAYGKYVERMGRLPAPMTADYGRLVDAGDVWVLDVDGSVVGLVTMRREADHVFVGNVAVASARQGRGYGRCLLEHAEAQAGRWGLDELRLFTNELMHENLALYERLGWSEYDRAEQDGYHRVFMVKRTTGASSGRTGRRDVDPD